MKERGVDEYSGEELDALAETGRYQEWIAEQFRPYLHGKIMEIGAGIGTMATKWINYADELHLVEPANNLFPALHEKFQTCASVHLHNGDLENILSGNPVLAKEAFDAIILINVLEHIQDDNCILKTIYRMLKPVGHLLVFVPAMPSLYGSLDRKFGHYRRYTKAGLEGVVKKAGYEIICSHYFDIFGVFPWWLINRVLQSSTLNPSMAKIYDGLVVPFARHAEKVITPPFGKNLVMVGCKTGK
jgi:ubiquinone/menaquinone biosynthesis C-methylase UbiE